MNKSNKYRRWDNYPSEPEFYIEYSETTGTSPWKSRIVPGQSRFKRKCKAAIYHRASGPEDALRASQISACREYCVRNGFPIVDTFMDTRPEPFDVNALLDSQGLEAVLGRMREQHERPAYDRAIAAIKEGRADFLVVYSPDHIFQPSEKRTLAYQLCYIPPVAFVEPWQDAEGEEEPK